MHLEAQLYPFPPERVIRNAQPGHRGDQVAVTHAGRTEVYDSPEQLRAGVLAASRHAIAAERDQAIAVALGAYRRQQRADAWAKARERRRLWAMLALGSVLSGSVAALAFVLVTP